MSNNCVCEYLQPIEFSINKRFCPSVIDEYFTLDLHFYGGTHLTNWGRFYTYDAAYEFGCNLIEVPLTEYAFKQPKEVLSCSAE